MIKDFSDEQLMTAIAEGDQNAFDVLVLRHTTRFYRLAYRMTGHVETAEDIVQDAFVKLWQYPDKWDNGKATQFTTWFYRIVVNLCLDYKRKHKVMLDDTVLELLETNDNLQDEDLYLEEKKQIVRHCFSDLPEKYKTVLGLFYYQELEAKQVAAIMNISTKAVQSLTIRAKTMLQTKVKRTMEGKNNDKNTFKAKKGLYHD